MVCPSGHKPFMRILPGLDWELIHKICSMPQGFSHSDLETEDKQPNAEITPGVPGGGYLSCLSSFPMISYLAVQPFVEQLQP